MNVLSVKPRYLHRNGRSPLRLTWSGWHPPTFQRDDGESINDGQVNFVFILSEILSQDFSHENYLWYCLK